MAFEKTYPREYHPFRWSHIVLFVGMTLLMFVIAWAFISTLG